MTKYHYVYRIDHLDSDHFYIGVRTSSKEPEKDPYMGSGIWINRYYRKHGKDRFKKKILATFDNREDALEFEKAEVDKYLGINKDCLNMCQGGKSGGFANWTFEERSQCNKKQWQDPEYREKTLRATSAAIKLKWQDPKYRNRATISNRSRYTSIKEITNRYRNAKRTLLRLNKLVKPHNRRHNLSYQNALKTYKHYSKLMCELNWDSERPS